MKKYLIIEISNSYSKKTKENHNFIEDNIDSLQCAQDKIEIYYPKARKIDSNLYTINVPLGLGYILIQKYFNN